jgi:hypothetical protein
MAPIAETAAAERSNEQKIRRHAGGVNVGAVFEFVII